MSIFSVRISIAFIDMDSEHRARDMFAATSEVMDGLTQITALNILV